MFKGIRCAEFSPMFGIVQLLLLLVTDSLGVVQVDALRRGQEIDCNCHHWYELKIPDATWHFTHRESPCTPHAQH